MSRATLSTLLTIAAASTVAFAQIDPKDPTPLVSKQYSYPDGIPYQVDYVPDALRGPQMGYNICNSTTENQQSMCQTSFVNSIDDFCLWAPPTPDSTIGDTEQEEVAWCTKPGHGTRVIPSGALTGIQVLKSPHYIQIAGFMDQTQLNIAAGDYGGELDPHGADLRGNPIGGLMYSNAYPAGNTNTNAYTQVIDWNSFVGGDIFCIKICDPASSQDDQNMYCQNIYDELGCTYNMPNNGQDGTFEVCDSDDMAPVGIYTSAGQTLTYSQPYTGTISVPYTPTPPASSNCVQYQSKDLFSGQPTGTPVSATPTSSSASSASGSGSSAPTATGSSSSGSGSASGSGSGSGVGSGSPSGSSSSAAASGTSNGAETLGISAITGLAGVMLALAVFA